MQFAYLQSVFDLFFAFWSSKFFIFFVCFMVLQNML